MQSGALRPFTCIICPRRVLACSMDTSSNRDAIAILMDGRMGLVCAVTGNSNRSGKATYMRDLRKMQEDSSVFPVSRGGSWRNDHSIGTSHSVRSYPASNSHLQVSLVAPDSGIRSPSYADSDPEQYVPSDAPTGRAKYPRLSTSTYQMPIEASPPTLYALLCSADDPPRSVAICPQRRCVAFGCSSGIELHWVDALTGEDLNRWFPLTAPSDYLYFLPPRAGVDSAKKLRLVSSQGIPGERSSLSERFVGRKKNSAFWGVTDYALRSSGVHPGQNEYDQPSTLRRVVGGSDHYRAVPLSDGYHLLFTDPYSGLLCLGNDAPLGGPTKLVRKLCFLGPIGEGSPICYAAGANLRYGVMVVAAYGVGREQSIWFFRVPADVFADCMGRGDVMIAPGFTSTAGGEKETGRHGAEWTRWWGAGGNGLYEWPHLSSSGLKNMSWPIQIRGQEVGKCMDIADLAVHSGLDIGITIWAFSRQGDAYTWNIATGGDGTVKQRWVVRDGTVREGDADGDTEMNDVDASFPDYDGARTELGDDAATGPSSPHYDGASSSSRRVSVVAESKIDVDDDATPMGDDTPALGLGDFDIELEKGKQRTLRRMARGSSLGWSEWSEERDQIVLQTHAKSRTADRDGEFHGFERGAWSVETHGRPEDDTVHPESDVRDWRTRRGRSRRAADPGMGPHEEMLGVQRIDFEIA